MCFLTWGPHDNNGATLFSGVRKIDLLNCPNTLQWDHLTRQNLNEIRLSAALMDGTLYISLLVAVESSAQYSPQFPSVKIVLESLQQESM